MHGHGVALSLTNAPSLAVARVFRVAWLTPGRRVYAWPLQVLGYMWALIYMTNGTIKTLRLAPDSNGSYEGVAELDELATS